MVSHSCCHGAAHLLGRAVDDRRAVLAQALLQLGVLRRLDEDVADLATSAGGMPAGPPSANQLATRSLGEAELDQRRHVRQRPPARVGVERQRAQLAVGEIGARRRQRRPGQIDAAGDQVGHHRRAAAIVHRLQRHLVGEQDLGAEQMRRRAEPRRADGQARPASCGPSSCNSFIVLAGLSAGTVSTTTLLNR